MSGAPKVLAVVPARSGSQGIVDKNLQSVSGKTLLEWAVYIGVNSPIVADTYVSTDSREYEALACQQGALSVGLRPTDLSGRSSKVSAAVLHLLSVLQDEGKEYDYVLLLQPTAPVRRVDDVEELLALVKQSDVNAAVSVTRFEEPHPYKLKTIESNGDLVPFIEGTSSEVSRQDMPDVYRLTGAYYMVSTEAFLAEKTFLPSGTKAYVTQASPNIDTIDDLELLRFLLDKGRLQMPDLV